MEMPLIFELELKNLEGISVGHIRGLIRALVIGKLISGIAVGHDDETEHYGSVRILDVRPG